MDWVINQGMASYWGTSEHTNEAITEIFGICEKLNLHKPVVEQCEYNVVMRDGLEKHYKSLNEKKSLGTTIWSPLAGGILAGRFNDGNIPEESRFSIPLLK